MSALLLLKLFSLLERRANVREENSPLIEPEGRRAKDRDFLMYYLVGPREGYLIS